MKLHKFIVRRFWCYKKISDASINKVPTDKTGLQNIRIFGMVTFVGLFILRNWMSFKPSNFMGEINLNLEDLTVNT